MIPSASIAPRFRCGIRSALRAVPAALLAAALAALPASAGDNATTGEVILVGYAPSHLTPCPKGWVAADGSSVDAGPETIALCGLVDPTGANCMPGKRFTLPDLRQAAPIAGLRYCIMRQGSFTALDDANAPFAGEIRLVAQDFCPRGWLAASGQTLNVQEHGVLFSLLQTAFGGDGSATFKLPDLSTSAPAGLRYCIASEGTYPSSH